MEYLQITKQFIIDHFSFVTFSLGLLFIISNTIDMSVKRNPIDPKDKLNTSYSLNIAGLTFIALFVTNEYLFPYINKNAVHSA